MTTFKRFSMALAVLWAAGIGAAHAVPASWEAEFVPPDDVFLNAAAATEAGRSLTFTLDLRTGPDGFRPGIDTIDDALLTILLLDDFDTAKEKVSFSLDNGALTSSGTLIGGFFPDLFTFSPLALLNDGLLTVTIRATQGDFFFDNAVLAAFGDRAAVPEPDSIALLGVGLFGIGFVLRRRLRNSEISNVND